jgi:hypothetical protein
VQGFSCGPAWIRTRDQRIKSLVVYGDGCRAECRAGGLNPHGYTVSVPSSKPVRAGNPRLGRFDSCAAPLVPTMPLARLSRQRFPKPRAQVRFLPGASASSDVVRGRAGLSLVTTICSPSARDRLKPPHRGGDSRATGAHNEHVEHGGRRPLTAAAGSNPVCASQGKPRKSRGFSLSSSLLGEGSDWRRIGAGLAHGNCLTPEPVRRWAQCPGLTTCQKHSPGYSTSLVQRLSIGPGLNNNSVGCRLDEQTDRGSGREQPLGCCGRLRAVALRSEVDLGGVDLDETGTPARSAKVA